MKTIRIALVSSVVVLAGLSSLVAQSSSFGGQLVGNAGPLGMLISVTGAVYTQDIGACTTPALNGTSRLHRFALSGAGGTAYDAARQGVWVSDGGVLVLRDLTSGQETCTQTATITARVTGLAHCNRRRELIQLETVTASGANQAILRFYDTSQCPPLALAATCSFPLPIGSSPGVARGLAYDEARDLIFFSSSTPTAAGLVHRLHYVFYGIACLVPPTVIPVPALAPCGGLATRSISGLAYDSCDQVMFITEGTVVLRLGLKNLSQPVNLNATTPCCNFTVTQRAWAGLAYVPKSSKSPVGQSCLGAPCGTCPNLRFDIEGDLVQGNQGLTLVVDGAPVGGTAALYLSIGNCSPAGVSIPGLCGLIHTPISGAFPLALGAFGLLGTVPCTAAARIPVAVPVDGSICNLPLCAQVLVTCSSAPGVGLTNAVQFKVGG